MSETLSKSSSDDSSDGVLSCHIATILSRLENCTFLQESKNFVISSSVKKGSSAFNSVAMGISNSTSLINNVVLVN